MELMICQKIYNNFILNFKIRIKKQNMKLKKKKKIPGKIN